MPSGTLFVVATPLGNLEDVTPRALKVLARAALVACEDTRRTRGLLDRHGIRPPRIVSCHKFNERRQTKVILDTLRGGEDVALVTDGGTPGLSDPAAPVVEAALAERLSVSPVPGPSAASAAISICGFPASSFLFAGFLPARAGERRRALEALRDVEHPIVFFEAPHRVAKAVAEMRDVLGDRAVTIARELTKLHEEVRRTTLASLADDLESGTPRGEFTLVVAGSSAQARGTRGSGASPDPGSLRRRYRELLATGLDRKDATRALCRETGLARRVVYDAVRGPNRDA